MTGLQLALMAWLLAVGVILRATLIATRDLRLHGLIRGTVLYVLNSGIQKKKK
jgi:hypothetical protein